MTFKVAARTLLHLGAELISSDGIAFYELIKNGLDAGSKKDVKDVQLDVVIVLPYSAYRVCCADILAHKDGTNKSKIVEASVSLETVRAAACEKIDTSASTAADALARLRACSTWEQLSNTLDSILSELNYITVSDTGKGMSLDDLTQIYLTIGTPSRLIEREQWKTDILSGDPAAIRRRPVLGEKGVGRLSAMRLGYHLHVETSRSGETHWNVLNIDWSRFSEDINALIQDVPIEPRLGALKSDPAISGTTIKISKLSSQWSRKKLEDIVSREFSKLVDPLTSGVRFPVKVFFNGKRVEIPRFNRLLFEHAHATVQATFVTDPEPRISGRIWYVGNRRMTNAERETTFELTGTHLLSVASGERQLDDTTIDTLRSLGPFDLMLYWYNRQRLTKIDGFGNKSAVLDILAIWAGGIMVFRDGFRVSPYGQPDDDWLDLDRRALARTSFKVNRRQILGKVDITSVGNPRLIDQTNREGLRDTIEKRELVHLLKWVIEDQLLGFLNKADKEKPTRESVDLDEIDERIRKHDAELDQILAEFSREYPEIDHQYRIKALIKENQEILRTTMSDVRERAEEYETGRAQLVHLAGVGLIVEILAHELNRATAHTLDTLTDAERQDVSPDVARVLSALEAQLRSLQKRLQTLDPLSTRGRQVKESFDLVAWVQDTLEAHRAQFQRHGIRLRFRVEPKQGAQLMVKAVKGMIVQILENLISNSVYWLKQERRLQPSFQPEIEVVVDAHTKQVRFSDNGPGIEAARRELVFRAFHSTKPPSAGNGLGLFIAQEIAEYHDVSLYLDPTPSGPQHTLHTFVFDLQPMQRGVSEEAR